MGLFNFIKSRTEEAATSFPVDLGAVCRGNYVAMEKIPDEVFSAGVLGSCCAIDPDEGKVYAPVGGEISQVADTLHAIGIEAAGMDILIHVGVDTVEMGGDGFKTMVRKGQKVKKGDLLLTMDVAKIHDAGHPATVILAVTNSDDFESVEEVGAGNVQPGDTVLRVSERS